MKPENAREILEIAVATYDAAEREGMPLERRWVYDLALRALDYEAASGEVTEEMVEQAELIRLGSDMRFALETVAPLLSAAARRKALEEAEDAAHDAIHGAIYEMGECERVKSVVKDALRALGRPA
jgi:hypothetical protein